jgi:hypothetical protein
MSTERRQASASGHHRHQYPADDPPECPTGEPAIQCSRTITVSAEAADSTGSITEVAFYEGSTPFGSATSVPYQVTWNNVPAGGYVYGNPGGVKQVIEI